MKINFHIGFFRPYLGPWAMIEITNKQYTNQ